LERKNDQIQAGATWAHIQQHRWIIHLFFALFVVSYFNWAGGLKWRGGLWESVAYGFLYLPGSIIAVYPMLYYLFPKYLYKKKFLQFFIGYMALIIAAKLVSDGLSVLTRDIAYVRHFSVRPGRFVSPFINISSLAASVELIRYFYFQENKSIHARKEKTRAELELLKSQIHPHFLFNTLNSLFAHTMIKSPASPRIVVELSDLLRFMVYESRVEFIPLEQEIQLLKNYINLERLRYGDDFDISFTHSGDIEHKLVRPLLLLPLLENAFKQGVSDQLDLKWISMNIHVENKRLNVKLANSYDAPGNSETEPALMRDAVLENVRKRLELSYPGEYVFIVKEEPEIFLVSLELPLHEDSPESFHIPNKIVRTNDLEMPVGG
jgi:cell division protein FtsB